ncbi:MAG TPA: protein kinase [Polyangia bacterium]
MEVAPLPVQTFGRYELLEKLGEGGMAEVFKARLRAAGGIDKFLVIKRILPQVVTDPEFIHLFLNEAKIALPLTHGNITANFEFGEVDGQFFLAMEYINGQDLATVLQRCIDFRERMPVEAALFIASEVAKGLNYAHSFIAPTGERVEVVHLDVSPQNVLISYDGAVKLTDFGIASLHRRPSQDGKIRGKACYLAPEQAMGRDLDGRADIFALGTVIYEALTGVRPFDAPDDLAAVAKVVKAEVTPPSKYRPGLGLVIEDVVLKAMARDPKDRYPRAADLQVALSGQLFQSAPSYTAQDLAEWMRDLFSWEIAEQLGESQRAGMRDRLLFQFARAKVSVDGDGATYEDLLRMGTVSIPAPAGSEMLPPAAEGEGAPTRQLRRRGSSPPALGLVGPAPAATATRRRRLILGGVAGACAVAALAAFPIIKGLGRSAVPVRAADGGAVLASEAEETMEVLEEPPGAATIAASGPTAPPPPSAKAVAVKRKVGYLSCNSWPWSIVYLDRRRLPGNTPVVRAKVPEGTHRLRFVNPELGLSKDVPVTIAAGVEKTVAVKLDR